MSGHAGANEHEAEIALLGALADVSIGVRHVETYDGVRYALDLISANEFLVEVHADGERHYTLWCRFPRNPSTGRRPKDRLIAHAHNVADIVAAINSETRSSQTGETA